MTQCEKRTPGDLARRLADAILAAMRDDDDVAFVDERGEHWAVIDGNFDMPQVAQDALDALSAAGFAVVPREPGSAVADVIAEAARVLLKGGSYARFEAAFEALTAGFDDGPEHAFAAALRALAGKEAP